MGIGSALRATRLGQRHAGALSQLLDQEPLVNVYLRSELRMGVEQGDWWGVLEGQGVRAALLGGALVVPCIPKTADARVLADAVSAHTSPRMLVGPRAAVQALFYALDRPAREVRDPQHLMAVDRVRFREQPPAPVRRARRSEIDSLVVAAAAMHREEMGVDPLSIDAAGWRMRMSTLVDRGWSWVWMEGDTVVFKAELSAWTPEAVQIQGVWSHPLRRGRGLGRTGLSAVCAQLLRDVPACTLYVNHYNEMALRVYQNVGFEKISDFTTVIY